MKTRSRRLLVASATAALALGGLSAAQAALPGTVGPSDFDSASTVGGASADFTSDGIAIDVPDATSSYAIGVFPVKKSLSAVNTVTYDWDGTPTRPGVKYNVDYTGSAAPDCQLVGEGVYDEADGAKDGVTHDVWLNKDYQTEDDEPADGSPCALLAPKTGDDTGSKWHGDLDDWAAKMSVAGKVPTVVQLGYGASGLVQKGTLKSITLGADKYTFASDEAPTPGPQTVNTTASVTRGTSYGVQLLFQSKAAPAGTIQGTKVRWRVEVNGTVAFTDSMGNGENASYRLFKSPIKGTSTVVVFKDGKNAGTYKLPN